jgi:hypothetical protein
MLVREHFKTGRYTAIGRKMIFEKVLLRWQFWGA